MVTWICRFMILVFAYNILIPEVVYAQTNQKSSNVQNPVEARLRAAYYATALPVQNWGLVPGTLPAQISGGIFRAGPNRGPTAPIGE